MRSSVITLGDAIQTNIFSRYKRRVLCFLLSHVIAHPFPFARIALLHSVEDVSDNTKAHMLIPAVKSLAQDSASVLRIFGPLFDEYTSLVLTAFLAITSAGLSGADDEEPWVALVGVLRNYFQSSTSALLLCLAPLELRRRRCKFDCSHSYFWCFGASPVC